MNFEEFSTEGLVSLYEAVRIALEEDDSRPKGNKKFGTENMVTGGNGPTALRRN